MPSALGLSLERQTIVKHQARIYKHEEDSWSIDDPSMPERLRNYL